MNRPEENSLWALINAGWFGLAIGTTIGIVSTVLAYIFYRRGRQVTRLSHMTGDAPIIGLTPTRYSDGLEVLFDGHRVGRVTSTSFGLWNSGTKTIYGRDIVEKDALRLELLKDGQMLRATVESETRDVNSAAVSLSGHNSAILTFDYLDPKDGFRVQVLHSGAPKSIVLKGTIRGLPEGVETFDPHRASGFVALVMIILVGVTALITLGLLAVEFANHVANEPWWKGVLYVVGIAGTLGLMAWLITRPEKPLRARKIKGVPQAISEDPTLNPAPIMITSPQGRVQITPEELERVNRVLPH